MTDFTQAVVGLDEIVTELMPEACGTLLCLTERMLNEAQLVQITCRSIIFARLESTTRLQVLDHGVVTRDNHDSDALCHLRQIPRIWLSILRYPVATKELVFSLDDFVRINRDVRTKLCPVIGVSDLDDVVLGFATAKVGPLICEAVYVMEMTAFFFLFFSAPQLGRSPWAAPESLH